MDSEEGQRMSRELYRRLDQLGLSEGKSSLNPYERVKRGLEVLTDKRSLSRLLRVPGRGTQPTEVSEGGTTVSSKILNVPEYQEEIEIGERGLSIHPPKLVEGPSDKGLRELRDLYLPIGGGMAITQMTAWLVPDKGPEGHSMVQVMLDLWKAKYGTSFFNIDTVTGQVYVSEDGKNNSDTRKVLI